VTLSAGVSQLAPDESVEQLVRRADEALYAAKDAGRNRTVVA
jgi:diguanylate cyclase (GGDEF)-like protein